MAAPRRRSARTEALWTIGAFVLGTVVFIAGVDAFAPQWYDREYEVRRETLAARVEEHPDRPVLLVVGSSRLVVAFMPEELGTIRDSAGREIIPFNYTHFGAGPRMNAVQVHRALRDGVRPKWIVLELVPGFLAHDDMPHREVAVADIPVIFDHSNKLRLLGLAAKSRSEGVYRVRTPLLRRLGPDFVTKSGVEKEISMTPLGGDLDWSRFDDPTPQQKAHFTGLATKRFKSRMEKFSLADYTVNQMNDLLEFCRVEGIEVGVVLSPEDSRYRSWYRPGSEGVVSAYLEEIRDRFGIRVVDGRQWVPDSGFSDPHHVNTAGAKEFTRRLKEEVIVPMVSGQ